MSNKKIIPYGSHTIDDSDIKNVIDVLNSSHLTEGPIVEKFEKKFSKIVGAKYSIVCSSGTAALHLVAKSLDLKDGDIVLVPSISFVATANAPAYVGLKVIFCDVDEYTGLVTPNILLNYLKKYKNIKAFFYVHLNGVLQDISVFKKICDDNKIKLVEDSCHAIGGSYNSVKVGSCIHSLCATFSFHPVKTITMGEGGVITTNSKKIAKKVKLLRSHGITKQKEDFTKDMSKLSNLGMWHYEMQVLGFNYRANNLSIALGLSQLDKLSRFVKKRAEIAKIYDKAFVNLKNFFIPVPRDRNFSHGYHLYPILLKGEKVLEKKIDLMYFLKKNNILTQVHYIPIPSQPYWKNNYEFSDTFEGANKYFERVLSLPIYPKMSNLELERVISAINSFFNHDN